ncbi:hypothetical protein ACFOMH_15565, partial [Paracoccus mangrovi]
AVRPAVRSKSSSSLLLSGSMDQITDTQKIGHSRFGEIKPNLPQIQRAPEWIACSTEQGTTVANTTPAIAGKARPDETQLDCFLRQPEAAAYPRFNPLIYSADTLLPIVSLEMQSYWIPDDRKPIGKTARLYLWLHIFAGWGLTLLAVAGFSGLIKTDNTK